MEKPETIMATSTTPFVAPNAVHKEQVFFFWPKSAEKSAHSRKKPPLEQELGNWLHLRNMRRATIYSNSGFFTKPTKTGKVQTRPYSLSMRVSGVWCGVVWCGVYSEPKHISRYH